MSVKEQEKIQEKYYSEAMRYMDNAKESLKKANKEGKFYRDTKYVSVACGTAYKGVLIALDGFLLMKGVEKPKGKDRKSIEFYHDNISKLDKKMLNYLNSAYKILHLYGYYDGVENVKVIKEGFDDAYTLINKIKPQDYKEQSNGG
jgi:phage-related tail protein